MKNDITKKKREIEKIEELFKRYWIWRIVFKCLQFLSEKFELFEKLNFQDAKSFIYFEDLSILIFKLKN
jgi:hypothetical protein